MASEWPLVRNRIRSQINIININDPVICAKSTDALGSLKKSDFKGTRSEMFLLCAQTKAFPFQITDYRYLQCLFHELSNTYLV